MALTTLKTPQNSDASIPIPLTTLTPLFTGGIGQHGEQIHPSGLLGSIRYFSCLVASAIGDTDFINTVWGNTGADALQAKQVALRWEIDGLQPIDLPDISIKREDGNKGSKWFFNCAQQGDLSLVLTKRGISEAHWNLLLLALRIQIRWASFGAKDQFGLGVLDSQSLPDVTPLRLIAKPNNNLPSLHRCFFTRILFKPNGSLNNKQRLEEGLRWRAFLRGQFRKPTENLQDKKLRHYLFGNIKKPDEYGSAVNISAAYPVGEQNYELRIWGAIPHTTQFPFNPRYPEIMQGLKTALNSIPDECHHINKRLLEFSPESEKLVDWINKLAGVKHA